MIAADDLPAVGARGAQGAEMIGGIDLEAIVRHRLIARRMNPKDVNGLVLHRPFEKTAAFARVRAARLPLDLRAQIFRQDERADRAQSVWPAGWIWPIRWPSSVEKM